MSLPIKKMKMRFVVGLAVSCLSVVASAASLQSAPEKLSYAMGVETGKAFRSHQIDVNVNAYTMGLQDAMQNKKLQMTETQIRQTLTQFQQESIKKMQSKMTEEGMKNKQMGAAFLGVNKDKPGVVT